MSFVLVLGNYGITVTGGARDFYDRTLDPPLVGEWLDAGKAEDSVIEQFELPKSS